MSRLSNLQAEVVQLVVAGAPVMLYTNKICKQNYIHHATCPSVTHLPGKGRNIFLTIFFFWRDIGGAVEEQWRNSGGTVEKQWSRRLLFCILQGREIQTQNPAVYCLPSTYSTFYYLLSISYISVSRNALSPSKSAGKCFHFLFTHYSVY